MLKYKEKRSYSKIKVSFNPQKPMVNLYGFATVNGELLAVLKPSRQRQDQVSAGSTNA